MTLILLFAMATTGCTLWDASTYRDNVARLSDADGDGASVADGDCNDADPDVHPGANDDCDGIDNDCDQEVDETPPDTVWCQDIDGDGFGDIAHQTRTCLPGSSWVMDCTDCNDSSALVNPAEIESCNGVDDNCDGNVDPADAAGATMWYPDRDGDGYGANDAATTSCTAPVGEVANNSDCDDTHDDSYPGATEICNDGRLNDCDGDGAACGWSGSRTLDTSLAAFIEGPESANENLGISVGFVDANEDGIDDLVFSSFGGMDGDETAGSLHTWYGAPSGARNVQDAHAHLTGTSDLYLGISATGTPALRLDDDATGGSTILVASAGFSGELDERGVILRAGTALYGSTTISTDAVYAHGASTLEGFGSTMAIADSLVEGGTAVVAGAPFNSDGATYGGAVYVSLPTAPNAEDAVATVLGDERDYLGLRVIADEDMNGDGMADLVLGNGYEIRSVIYVFDGPLEGLLTADDASQTVRDDSWYTDTTTVLPDANGDGLPDIAVGGPDAVSILAGSARPSKKEPEVMVQLVDDEPSGTGAGYSLAVEDINADLTWDLLVAAPFLDTPSDFGGVVGGGALAVVPLDPGYSGQVDLWGAATAVFYGPDTRGHAGVRLAVGDVNADGFADMLVGAPYWSSNGYPSAGGVWFILGGGI